MNPNEIKEKDLSRALPYPKIMFEINRPENIILAMDTSSFIFLSHKKERTGTRKEIRYLQYFHDYDGVIPSDWMDIIEDNYRVQDIPHFAIYRNDTHRRNTRKKDEFFKSRSNRYKLFREEFSLSNWNNDVPNCEL